MSIARLDFDNLAEGDLVELVTGQVPEGLHLEYKRELYGNSDGDRKEYLKDVSAFANAFGGHLLIGVREEAGVAADIPGLATTNPDDVVLRLGQLARDGVEPRLQGLRVRAVPLANGMHCIVLRVARSWHPPHRVRAQSSNRFWTRNSGGAHEASIEELRAMFTLGADALDRIRRFRDERLREILTDSGARPLYGNGRIVIHIVPLAAFTSPFEVDIAKAYELQQLFRPIGSNSGMNPRFNFEGYISERGGVENLGFTQVFRNGSLEATKAHIVVEDEGKRFIRGPRLEESLFEVLPHYLDGMRDLAVPPPLLILISLEGVSGVAYRVSVNDFDVGMSFGGRKKRD
jgi:Schlafen, AlbA_2